MFAWDIDGEDLLRLAELEERLGPLPATLNAAYDVLHDPVKRAGYDRTRTVNAAPETVVWMSFRRYEGQPIGVVPTSYLLWAQRSLENEDYLFDVTQELVRRGAMP